MYVYGNNKSYLHLFAGYILNYRNNKLSAIYLDTYILRIWKHYLHLKIRIWKHYLHDIY